MRVCSTPGCGTIYPTNQGSRCKGCRVEADKRRGTSTERGYHSKGHKAFRAAVLRRDPICVLCHIKQADTADHYPLSRKELIAKGMNPNDPTYGRGLDKQCHDRETARHQPGGWNTPS